MGRSLSGFVGDNFLDPELVTQKVHSAQIPRRVGTWLGGEGNAERVGAEVGRFVARVVAAIDENEAVAIVDRMVVARLAEPAWGPPLSRVLVPFLDEGRDEPLLQQLADFAHTRALESFDVIERAVGERAPTWAPDFVNELVGERVYRELVDTTWAIRSDPRHPVRLAIRRRLREFAEGLEHDPELIAKIEDLKRDLLDGERVPAISRNLWRAVRIGLIDATADPGSVLRVKIVEFVEGYGERLREDSALRAQVDRRIGDAAAFVARNYAGEITSIISETVERWDADEAGRKIELMVGRDLQFIRINGTVVGALAGLGIYSISTLLFGH